jgi:hypothetical protein
MPLDLYMFHIDLDFVFDKALMVVVVNNIVDYFVEFVLVDDYNHQSKHVMIELDEEIIMVLVLWMVDDVLQLMLMQLLDEVLMDLLDDDFLLSKIISIHKKNI